jgi:glycosyltransferase involved in cell wall biosynthesis
MKFESTDMKNFNYDDFRRLKVPSEAEITRNWQGDLSIPVVSVICTTFNHVNYIDDAVRGFLIQKTDFPFEIIIHDDASTDTTQEIIKRYAKEYPRLIKLVIQTENQHSQGKSVSACAVKYSHAEILAFCEGDDFWIDENKLSLQTKIMRSNPDTALIVHPCIAFNGNDEKSSVSYIKGDKTGRFDAQDVLNVAAQFAPTSSYMFRRHVYDILPDWLDDAPVTDFLIEMYSMNLGVGLYTPEVMSVYRTISIGSWMDRRRKKANGDALLSFGRKMSKCLGRMQREDAFSKLNFNVKKSALHLELATGYLLNNNPGQFKKHIIESYKLRPDSSLIQRVFLALRWFPATARLLFRAKRRYNSFFHLA